MIAAGNIKLAALYEEDCFVTGLPFTPRRILFRCATTTTAAPTSHSYGIWSADRPDSADFPQQAVHSHYISAGNSHAVTVAGLIARIQNIGSPATQLSAYVLQVADNAFVVRISVNTLTADSYLQWIATP